MDQLQVSKLLKKVYKIKKENFLLKKELYEDKLTSLPNKKALEENLEKDEVSSLIFFKIRSFKTTHFFVEEKLHSELILEVASKLRSIAKNNKWKLYRIGRDTFAFLRNGNNINTDIYLFCSKLKDFFIIRDSIGSKNNIEVSSIIGFAQNHQNIFKKTLLALKYAEEKGLLCIEYNDSLEQDLIMCKTKLSAIQIVKHAVRHKFIAPYFQPICDKNYKITKYEVLMRIINQKEALSPTPYLSVAKEIHSYAEMEKMLLSSVFNILQANQNLVLSINLSVRDMIDDNINLFILQNLEKLNVGNRIVFEIIEDEKIEDIQKVQDFVIQVKKFGCKIAIDDFGSGYSNFSYMLKLKPDYIKIDGSIIQKIHSQKESFVLASTIVAFAKDLGIKTIAEFINNEETLNACIALGIDEFQGFFLGEPAANF